MHGQQNIKISSICLFLFQFIVIIVAIPVMGHKFELHFGTSSLVHEAQVINKFPAFYIATLFYPTIAASRSQVAVIQNFNVK